MNLKVSILAAAVAAYAAPALAHHSFSMFDMDGPKAEATRRAFFDRVIAEKGTIAGYHFGFPNVGTISKDGSGYAFEPVKA